MSKRKDFKRKQAIKDNPPPKRNQNPAIWDMVIADMQDRDRVGRKRYGTRLQAHNGRDALIDAYQESLDLCVYLRQEIEERKKRHVFSWSNVWSDDEPDYGSFTLSLPPKPVAKPAKRKAKVSGRRGQ